MSRSSGRMGARLAAAAGSASLSPPFFFPHAGCPAARRGSSTRNPPRRRQTSAEAGQGGGQEQEVRRLRVAGAHPRSVQWRQAQGLPRPHANSAARLAGGSRRRRLGRDGAHGVGENGGICAAAAAAAARARPGCGWRARGHIVAHPRAGAADGTLCARAGPVHRPAHGHLGRRRRDGGPVRAAGGRAGCARGHTRPADAPPGGGDRLQPARRADGRV